MIIRELYSTDISDSQWQLVESNLPQAKSGGRKRKTNLREVLNAIFYMLRAGCAWRLLPHDFPKWRRVYGYFRQWQEDGTWKKLNHILRKKIRLKAGRNANPSAGCLDSQSVRKAGAGQESGYDGGKKVNGRKRTILVDTMGLLLDVVVHSGHRSDHQGLTLLGTWFAPLWQCLQLIWTDSIFDSKNFTAWVNETFGWNLEVVSKKNGQKDYEYLPTTSETMIHVAMLHLILRRLCLELFKHILRLCNDKIVIKL
ncbi:transposase [Synechocystis sp. PCC 6803]|uniref:Transposase n=1 Tax=Synechocystis sp. (strain ATCC 27184 / PCC 6803 / Kazusa) TaxID=1111708 RepID=P74487_SYNY3|nr:MULTISPECIES: IS5 family transposase [unclassified Synechocystis]AGF52276.1 transposase [Synechocystis sp. PCC 6803]ALJ68219.1 transposase [Synechocystis sp. PCC 6803]AVP90062.1 IS5 family transposase [Synechocystis sp. IPPAS B-1465]MBD2620078.1 IS5 family transposase [Synechocystis sp. FACHB-898]MBD2640609.1 IS5 family transposase [Synechocystis sp. FACHB-908]